MTEVSCSTKMNSKITLGPGTVFFVFMLGVVFYVLGALGESLAGQSNLINHNTVLTVDIIRCAIEDVGFFRWCNGALRLMYYEKCILLSCLLSLSILVFPRLLSPRWRIGILLSCIIVLFPYWLFGIWTFADFIYCCVTLDIRRDGEFLAEAGFSCVGWFFFFISLVLVLRLELKKRKRRGKGAQ